MHGDVTDTKDTHAINVYSEHRTVYADTTQAIEKRKIVNVCYVIPINV